MAVTEIAKIQLRAGSEIDLPGAPTSVSPLVFSTALDTGELAYTMEAGRLFIGHSPKIGQAHFQRTAFPYQNVEVLTEASTDLINRFIGSYGRDVGSDGFYKATLAGNTEWANVSVLRQNGASSPYVIAGNTLLATIDYHVITNGANRIPVRTGVLRVMSDPNGDEALVRDDCIALRRADLVTPSAQDSNSAYENVQFRLLRNGSQSDPGFNLQYDNTLPDNLTLFFQIKRPLSDTISF